MTVTSRSTAARKKATFLPTRNAKKMSPKIAHTQTTVQSAKTPSTSLAKKSPPRK